jgi:hypothetical protein
MAPAISGQLGSGLASTEQSAGNIVAVLLEPHTSLPPCIRQQGKTQGLIIAKVVGAAHVWPPQVIGPTPASSLQVIIIGIIAVPAVPVVVVVPPLPPLPPLPPAPLMPPMPPVPPASMPPSTAACFLLLLHAAKSANEIMTQPNVDPLLIALCISLAPQ